LDKVQKWEIKKSDLDSTSISNITTLFSKIQKLFLND
jgi:hypothetical protein